MDFLYSLTPHGIKNNNIAHNIMYNKTSVLVKIYYAKFTEVNY